LHFWDVNSNTGYIRIIGKIKSNFFTIQDAKNQFAKIKTGIFLVKLATLPYKPFHADFIFNLAGQSLDGHK
jgi:hypothetical protein